MTTKKRRAPGEGGVYPYSTKTKGQLWYLKCQVPDPMTGGMKTDVRRGFKTKDAALKELRKVLAAVDAGTYKEASDMPFVVYLNEWVNGLRRKEGTINKYKKAIRLHVAPTLGAVPLGALTPQKFAALYRKLQTEGRKDGKGGLKPATVLVIHCMVHGALKDAVNAGLLAKNPADSEFSNPPTAAEAKAPEMQTWTAEELSRFLTWCKETEDGNYVLWLLAAATGTRRGELAALRWKDVDFQHARVSVRRAVVEIKEDGNPDKPEERKEDTPKGRNARVIDLDPATVTTLKNYRKERGEISLVLRSPDALVFPNPDGELRSLDPISVMWKTAVRRFNRDNPGAELPGLRLHGLRHTHATLLLAKGTPIKVVSERLGHASVRTTMETYAHVLPSMQKAAADTWGALLADAG
jgi:integrase